VCDRRDVESGHGNSRLTDRTPDWGEWGGRGLIDKDRGSCHMLRTSKGVRVVLEYGDWRGEMRWVGQVFKYKSTGQHPQEEIPTLKPEIGHLIA